MSQDFWPGLSECDFIIKMLVACSLCNKSHDICFVVSERWKLIIFTSMESDLMVFNTCFDVTGVLVSKTVLTYV